MIDRDYCFVAETEAVALWGYVCASVRQPGLAQIRGLGLVNDWSLAAGVQQLLDPLEAALRNDDVQHVLHLGIEKWTVSPLEQQRFSIPDYIVNYERPAPKHPLLPDHQNPLVELRPLFASEIEALALLDWRTFPWPWQLTTNELVHLMMSASQLMVLDYQGILVGYACTDLLGAQAQIVRIAVDPVYQGLGFGRYLLADALDFAAEAGAQIITLNTQSRNQASQRLYHGFDFRLVGRRIPVMIKQLP